MPGLWAVLAWVRRQFAYTLDETTLSLNGLVIPTQPRGLVVPTQLAAPAAAIGPETPGATGIFDLTAIYNAFVYQPLNGLVQFWITSPLGELVDGVINDIFGRGGILIGNGADGTAQHPDGVDGGLLFGNGGDGFDGVSIGVAGGDGGNAGWWGEAATAGRASPASTAATAATPATWPVSVATAVTAARPSRPRHPRR